MLMLIYFQCQAKMLSERELRVSQRSSASYISGLPNGTGGGWGGGWIVAMAQTNMAVIRPCNFAVMCECVTAKLLFT